MTDLVLDGWTMEVGLAGIPWRLCLVSLVPSQERELYISFVSDRS